MNSVINLLSEPEVNLTKNHINYLISNDIINKQIDENSLFKGCHELYADPVTENLLTYCQPKIEEAYGKPLFPTYSFWRVYYKGQSCPPHKDRPSCEVSVTLNLGGDQNGWSFYAEESKYDLKLGEGLLYKGCDQEHWRNSLDYEYHMQVFLHYIEQNGEFDPHFKFDRRQGLYGPSVP